MPTIPRDKSFDRSSRLLSEGYLFVSNRCRELETDAFETRLMLERVVCMRGAEAARIFYGGDRFSRKKAMPQMTLRLLQDIGSVQQLEGERHRHRKAMFMSFMTPAGIEALAEAMERHWMGRLSQWERADQVSLLDEIETILCLAACEWAGVPLGEREVELRTRELAAMIEAAGSVGPAGWWAMLLRRRCERWAQGIVEAIRDGKLAVAGDTPAHAIAWHREPDGELLPVEFAAVELLNVLRPIVAVALFVMFSAMALQAHPEWRERLRSEGDPWSEPFVQEVRRFYPFFPFIGGRVRTAFEWHGYDFREGAWVVLDLYGTNHDPRIWSEPDAFRPERFRDWNGDAFGLIPQGGGEFASGHRCPGEWATIALMKRALRLLTSAMDYEVPEQDLQLDLSRTPAIPKSRFIVRRVGSLA